MLKNVPKLRLRKNSRPHKILKGLATGTGILVISILAPAGGAQMIREIISGYFRKKYFERSRFLADLKNLQERNLITYREFSDGKVEMKITRKGKEVLLKYELDNVKLKKGQWDKKWRLVMFDIPQKYRLARDAFRQKLKYLEFHQLQKSVFITPYPCEDEIDFIAQIFDVRKYILILYVERFEGEEKLKRLFRV
ncbi:MAG: hypothetical protein Q8P01_04405 [bacterium]|nr:hypothetical protein [bacterium]